MPSIAAPLAGWLFCVRNVVLVNPRNVAADLLKILSPKYLL
jgi:hypothetical protein